MNNDPYTDTQRCVDRLLDIYKKRNNLIIAVDFDDTVYDFHDNRFAFPRVINTLRKCNELNLDIVMFTASKPERFPFIIKYMEDTLGIEIEGINRNILPDFPFGNDGKIFYNILLDDRAGLGEALNILQETLEKIQNL